MTKKSKKGKRGQRSRQKETPPQNKKQTSPQSTNTLPQNDVPQIKGTFLQRLRDVHVPWWGSFLGILTFFVAIPGWYLSWRVVPAVQPDNAISASWLDLPITVRNPSEVFDLRDVQFFCDMTEQQFNATAESKKFLDYNYYRAKGLVEWPIRQPPLTLSPGNAISFPCNIAANTNMTFDGAPLPLLLIRLSIKSQYSVDLKLFRWHRQSMSQTFTWQKVPGGWQWLPGETLEGPH